MKNSRIFLALGIIASLMLSQSLVADFWHNTRARLTGKPNPLVGPNGEIGQQGTAGKLVDSRTSAQAKADLDEINRKSAEADRLRIQAKKEKDARDRQDAQRIEDTKLRGLQQKQQKELAKTPKQVKSDILQDLVNAAQGIRSPQANNTINASAFIQNNNLLSLDSSNRENIINTAPANLKETIRSLLSEVEDKYSRGTRYN